MSTTDDTGTPTRAASGRHPVEVGHLVMGLAFLGLAAVWALVVGDVVAEDDTSWLLPLPWVLAGAGGLVALVVRDRRRARRPGPGTGGPGDASTMER